MRIRGKRVGGERSALASILVVATGCGCSPSGNPTADASAATDAALRDAPSRHDAGPVPSACPLAPYTAEHIDGPADTAIRDGWKFELYRNPRYSCAESVVQAFVVAYPIGDDPAVERPLWVRLHGGSAGAFTEDGAYAGVPIHNTEAGLEKLGGQLFESGLVSNVREGDPAFRFLFPSMCDHDVYSGIGRPEPFTPHPDERVGNEGGVREADGHLALRAALDFTRNQWATGETLLHGTSAGAMGAMTLSIALGCEGESLAGAVLDAAVISPYLEEMAVHGCTKQSPAQIDLIAGKVGPYWTPEHMPHVALREGRVSTPIYHFWSDRDPNCHGDPVRCDSLSIADDAAGPRTGSGCDMMHGPLAEAIVEVDPGGASLNHTVCLDDPAVEGDCDLHSATKWSADVIGAAEDHNAAIYAWVGERLADGR